MNRTLLPAVLLVALGLLAGCEPFDAKPPAKKGGGWHPPTPVEPPTTPEEPKPEPPPKPTTEAPPTPTGPAVPEQPKNVGELPYAKAVPGKPGFVTSPFDPYKGYIDVRGYPPGTEVKDPYGSGKTFLVPPFN
jgi:hypothetical protein